MKRSGIAILLAFTLALTMVPVTVVRANSAEEVIDSFTYTSVREDYPQLTDEEFANFRAVKTTGIPEGKLYRSASPIDPMFNRHKYADAALAKAGVTVIMNLSDYDQSATMHPGFYQSYYCNQKYINLNMEMDFYTKDFKNKLAKGLKFFAKNPGVYEIHCIEGKDRTGFVCGLLECLMGASKEEIVADYMVTYYNYYGIEPGDEYYDLVANYFMENMAKAFEIDSLDNVDLQAEAREYIRALGLTKKQLRALENNLGKPLLAN